jgi:hypothetical protein
LAAGFLLVLGPTAAGALSPGDCGTPITMTRTRDRGDAMFTTPLEGPHARPARPGTVPCRCGVAELAESRLRSNAYLALRNVTCTFDRGVLTLAGWLPTYYLKQLAQEVVAGVDGVEQVVNRIEVLTPGRARAAERELCRA